MTANRFAAVLFDLDGTLVHTAPDIAAALNAALCKSGLVPIVDTSNPFIARTIPTADESFIVIRFTNARGIDFPYLLSMLHDSFMSRPNTIVAPGGKTGLAMELIFTPMILQLMDRKKRALAA